MRALHQLTPFQSFVYQALVLVWVGSEISIGVRTVARRFASGRAVRFADDRWSGIAAVGGVFVSVWAGLIVGSALPAAAIHVSVWFLAGAVIAVAGIVVRLYSVASLGRWFEMRVTTSPDQPVIQTGPYRLVRHPSYAGGLLTVLGMQLMMVNWLALACFALALPGFAYRIHVEESVLMRDLGDPYRDYMKRTKRLIPFVL